MNDDSARPAIRPDLSKVEDYDKIYLGYPIWWGTAPRIIETFLEKYDVSGAKIYTFCTSGQSGIGRSLSDLRSLYPKLNIVSGKRFADASEKDVADWVESTGK
jgi:flavodoxin